MTSTTGIENLDNQPYYKELEEDEEEDNRLFGEGPEHTAV